MGTRSRVADWISITTAPFSVFSVVGSLTGWLPSTVANHADSYEKRLAIAIILTTAQWFFLFSLLIRYLKVQARIKSDLGCLFSMVSLVVGLAVFIAAETIVLHAVVFPMPQASLVFWLGIPTIAWVFFGLLALLIVHSEA